ncbi:MAG: ribonuclease [Thermotogota bacterium]|nr:ribonuclease [Thermotogota bacterium]
MDRALDSGSRGCGFDSRQARQMDAMEKGKRIRIFTDGGSSGNPGKAAAGFVVYERDKLIALHGESLGYATNNFAEYRALELALEWIKSRGLFVSQLDIFCDSELLVKQLTGEYKVRSGSLREIHQRIKEHFQAFKAVEVNWIPREKNRLADWLVKSILKGEKAP